jgi:hypothetical protein
LTLLHRILGYPKASKKIIDCDILASELAMCCKKEVKRQFSGPMIPQTCTAVREREKTLIFGTTTTGSRLLAPDSWNQDAVDFRMVGLNNSP